MSWRVLVIAVLILAAARVARADDSIRNPDAKVHYDAANAYYNAGNFDRAIVELKEAYSLEPQPVILYALAQAERKAGRCDEAIPHYNRYQGQGVTPAQHQAAQTNIEKCAAERLHVPPPAPAAKTNEAATTTTVQIDEPSPWYRDRVGNMLAGSGIVIAGAGGVFFAFSLHEKSKSEAAMNIGDYRDAREPAQRDRIISIGCFAVGAALVTAGIIHYRHHGRSRSVDVSTFIRGHGGGLALATSF